MDNSPESHLFLLGRNYAMNLPLQQNQHALFLKNVTWPIICACVTAVRVTPSEQTHWSLLQPSYVGLK